MEAYRLHEIGRDLQKNKVPPPTPKKEEITIDVKASGICHSDINYREGIGGPSDLPKTLGHEIAGVVHETGGDVSQVMPGDRVMVHYLITCGNCYYCRGGMEYFCDQMKFIGRDVDGGFAEFIKVPEANAVKLPNKISFEEGAMVGCAGSTSFHALRKSKIETGDTVAIFGAGGSLGMSAVAYSAKIFGAGKIIALDKVDQKLDIAKRMGADKTINVQENDPVRKIDDITSGEGADVILDFVGIRTTVKQSVKSAGLGGKIILVGISPERVEMKPYEEFIQRELELIGLPDHTRNDLLKIIKLLETYRLDLSPLITHKISLDEVNEGLKMLEEGEGNPIKIEIIQ